MKMLSDENITHQVFLAVDMEDEELYLPMNEKVSLEYLSMEYDGIFETERSWRSFIQGNFLGTGVESDYFQPIKESTVKRWCRAESEYKHRFMVQVGVDKWIPVDPDDIELSFDYEMYYSRKLENSNFPSAVEILVKAEFKEKD